MTSIGVHLEGLDVVEASVAAVVQALHDPATAHDAALLVAAKADPPVATGALARSETVSGATLVYGVPYSVIAQARQPWLGQAITDAVPAILELYGDTVQEAWT